MKKEFDFFSNKNVNRGWEDMRGKLDKDMPVPIANNRWVFWFWLGVIQSAILMVAFGVWYIFLKNISPETSPKPENIIQPVAAQVPIDATTVPQIPKINSTKDTEHKVKVTRLGDVKKSFESKPNNKVIHLDAKINKNLEINKNTSPAIENLSAFNIAKNETIEPLESNLEKLSKLIEVIKSEMKNNNIETQPFPDSKLMVKLEEVNFLIMAQKEVFLSKKMPKIEPVELIVSSSIIEEKKKLLPVFGLTTGVHSINNPIPNGFIGGLVFDYKPIKKIGFRTGINYQYTQIKATQEVAPVVGVEVGEYLHYTQDKTIVDSTAPPQSSDQFYIPIAKQHKLEIPILAYWQPVDKLRVYGGFTVGRILKVTSSDYTITESRVHDAQNAKFRDEGANTLVEKLFPKWSLDYQAGLGLPINKRIELNLFVKNSLVRQKSADYSFENQSKWYLNPKVESVTDKIPLPSFQLTGTIKF
jgi:hypothetical protein